MKRTGPKTFATRLAGALLTGAALFAAAAAQPSRVARMIDGESLGDLKIGSSTRADVIAAYGGEFEYYDHKGYSGELIYRRLGVSFYWCQADPDEQIFSIEMTAPFQVMNDRGFVLGQSTLGDVFRIYGGGARIFSDNDQPGVQFFVGDENPEEAYGPQSFEPDSDAARAHLAKPVKRVLLIEKSGLRQCGLKFPERKNQ